MYYRAFFFENQIFHASVSNLLPRLAEQDHKNNPLYLLDINVRTFERKKTIYKDFALRRRKYSYLFEIGYKSTARSIQPIQLEVGIDACSVCGLRVVNEVTVTVRQTIEPVQRPVDFAVAKSCRSQLIS